MSSADVSSLFSLCRCIAASETDLSKKAPSVPRGRCSGSTARWGISGRSVKSWGLSAVGRQPVLHDDIEPGVYTCFDSPRRRSSTGSLAGWNLRVLFVRTGNLNNVAPTVTLPDRQTDRLGELGIEHSVLPRVSLDRGLVKFFELVLSQSWNCIILVIRSLIICRKFLNSCVHKKWESFARLCNVSFEPINQEPVEIVQHGWCRIWWL